MFVFLSSLACPYVHLTDHCSGLRALYATLPIRMILHLRQVADKGQLGGHLDKAEHPLSPLRFSHQLPAEDTPTFGILTKV